MKKYLLGLAITAALAGCSSNETTEAVDSSRQISFSSLNDKVVGRAANAASSDYQVLAALSTSPTAWFIDEVVGGTSNVTNSGNSYYWPGNSQNVDFWAYAPATGNGVAPVTTFGSTSVVFTVPTNADTDFTVANKVTQNAGTVPFKFNHMLAQLKISAALDADLQSGGYTIKTQPTAKVTLVSNGATIDPTAATPDWTTPTGTGVTYSGFNSYMVIPQSAVGVKIQLVGMVIAKDGVADITKTMKEYTILASDVTGDLFKKGTSYAITFTVKNSSKDEGDETILGDKIEFSAEEEPWATAAPGVTLP